MAKQCALIILSALLLFGRSTETVFNLFSNIEATHKVVPGQSIIFKMKHLEPNMRYEARVSYPAVTPVAFKLSVVSTDQMGPHFRSLLNADKIVFSTDASGFVLEHDKSMECGQDECFDMLKVSTLKEGISYSSELETRPIVFHIILEPYHIGLPARSLGLVWFLLPAILGLISLLFYTRVIETILPDLFNVEFQMEFPKSRTL
jgi:hypothetical protein